MMKEDVGSVVRPKYIYLVEIAAHNVNFIGKRF